VLLPEDGGTVVTSALKKNTTLKCLHVFARADEVVNEVLKAAVLSNYTLQKPVLGRSGSCSWLSPLFLAL
jgi:hypothetical protein